MLPVAQLAVTLAISVRQRVKLPGVVGATGVGFTVTVSVVAVGLGQPKLFTQTKVKSVVPVAVVEIANEANVVDVAPPAEPPAAAAVEPSTPVTPLLLPVATLAELDEEAVARTQSVNTVSEAPWHIATAPD